ncbi:MAG: 8-amino-7-oxononanoate synthase [Candidatus Omnitrophica bacterium]|nr:8-amino-7-oxononanoate synthase [Candidatus Omnitrophota bacterium]
MGQRKIIDFIQNRENDGLLRTLSVVEKYAPGKITVAGKEYINFSSNDYIGLAHHSELLNVIRDKGLNVYASASSRLMTGTGLLHNELEIKTASFKNKEAAMVFNSGYQANVGVISAMVGKGDAVFCDKLVHASIIDGSLLSGCKLYRFNHNDPAHLEYILDKYRKKYDRALLAIESIYSMDGDRAKLSEFELIKEKYDLIGMVDEAHATGIFGKNGSGLVEEEGNTASWDIIMGTFSKALGGFGAYIACDIITKKYLINTCRSYIYSTSLPFHVIASDIKSLDIIKEEPVRRKDLLEKSVFLRNNLKSIGLNVLGESQIIPTVFKDAHKTLEISEKLKSKGHWVTAVRPPTVPGGTSRLRISLNYDHSMENISDLVNAIKDCI